MPLDYPTFARNADEVFAQIADACGRAGRDPADVKLLAVTKTHGSWAPEFAARYGLKRVGENRVQEAVDKMPQVDTPLAWELIGHLQSNKARLAAAHFDRIQSVDSAKLLRRLDAGAAENERPLAVLLQINAGDDPAKFGADLTDAPALLEVALTMTHLDLEAAIAAGSTQVRVGTALFGQRPPRPDA